MGKFLHSKYFALFCCIFNLVVMAAAYKIDDWALFFACSLFAIATGYSFWLHSEEK